MEMVNSLLMAATTQVCTAEIVTPDQPGASPSPTLSPSPSPHPSPGSSSSVIPGAVETTDVSNLAYTGSEFPTWWILAGVVLLVVGVVLVLLVRRRNRGAVLGCGILLAGGLIFAPGGAPSVQAAPADVVYSQGCTLMEVKEVTLGDGGAAQLLPGDHAVALSVRVENAFTAPIAVHGTATLAGNAELLDQLGLTVLFEDGPGPVTLAAGESARVQVVLALDAAAENAYQGVSAPVSLVLEAVEQ